MALSAAFNKWRESDKVHIWYPIILFLGLFRYMYPDQIAPYGAVLSGSLLLACKLELICTKRRKVQFDIIRWHFQLHLTTGVKVIRCTFGAPNTVSGSVTIHGAVWSRSMLLACKLELICT